MKEHPVDSVSGSIAMTGSPDRVYRALTDEFGTWFQVLPAGPFQVDAVTSRIVTMTQVAGLLVNKRVPP